jgi:hypothetical protein
MTEEKSIVVYHYKRDKETFTTPNVEIAISRRNVEYDINVETIKNGNSHWSTLAIS